MSTTADPRIATTPPLEAEAQAFADANANPPFLYDLGPEKGREVVNQTQAGDIAKPDVVDEWIEVPGGPVGDVPVRIVRPAGATGTLPAILYIHGAGWVFGNAGTHGRLVRELAVGAQAAVVFPEYSLSPEVHYPVAVEEIYAVARWLAEGAQGKGLDTSRVAVAGDSVGGNMTIATTMLAKQRGDLTFAAQVLFYPVTDAAFDTDSYHEFAEGFWLTRTGMRVVLGPVHHRPHERAAQHREPSPSRPGRARGVAEGVGHQRRVRRASRRGRGVRAQPAPSRRRRDRDPLRRERFTTS